MIGNVAPEPIFEDFLDQAFEESQLFFADQQGSHLEHFAPVVIFSLYSVVLELHDTKVYVALLC
jgi:hypothetical protein